MSITLAAHHDHHHPLSRAWLRGLIVETAAGDITYRHTQELTAYYCWKRRVQYHDEGDAVTDWLEAADMLNDVAEACEIAVLPW